MQYPYISMYSRSQPASAHSTAHDATVGERDRKQKNPYSEHAQDHYGDCILLGNAAENKNFRPTHQPRITMETAYKV